MREKLVCLVCLVCLVEEDQPDRPNRPDRQDRPNKPDRPHVVVSHRMNVFLRRARTVGFTAGLLLCAGMATAPAMASSVPITFTFTGKVTEVGYEMGEHFGGPFRLYKPVTGSYTFNPDTPDTPDQAPSDNTTVLSMTPSTITHPRTCMSK